MANRTEPNRTEPNRTEPNRTEIIHENQNNFKQNKILQLKQLFPEIFCEEQIDFEKLKLVLGEDNLCAQNERYQLGWAGKSDAYRTLQSPTFNTLAPCIAESVNFHDTQNVFIEAENLEALKILQKSYAGKVKMIYIDPPYNTGSDSFVYPDKFAETRDEYARRVGDKDQDGYLLRDGTFAGAWRKNSKDNGHYHSNWLSMMLPRLHLAKTLLREDGVIFISIDDNEQAQLKLLCDEVFGAENHLGTIIIKTATDNNPSQINVEHEYIFCYAKDKEKLKFWQSENEKAKLIFDKYQELKIKFNNDIDKIQIELRNWIKKNKDILEGVTHYDNVDEKGVFHDGDIANTTYGGYEYDVIHPITKKICKIPDKGFRFEESTMKQMIANNDIMFGKDENILIKPKKRIEFAKDILRSVIYEDGRTSTKAFETLMARDIFQNPKSTTILSRLINFVVKPNDLVMDFFGGSGTTAEAVMQLNARKNMHLKFIIVQLPENLDLSLIGATSKAKKTIQNAIKFLDAIGKKHTIDEIAKERIRRAGTQIAASLKDGQSVDTGFKVFKLTESHFKQWRRPLSGSLNDQQQLALLEEFQNIVHENAGVENMAYELMLRLGFELTDSIEFIGNVVWLNNTAQTRKTALLLDTVNQAVLDEVRAQSPKKVFVLDKAFAGDDALKTNAALQFKDANIDFETL